MREPISTPEAPQAIGPYSQGIQWGALIFTSGQIPLDPKTGGIVGGEIRAQMEQVLKNLKAILEARGSGLSQVLKTTVYLKDLADFQGMNEVYGQWFAAPYPARATVQVARLPKDVLVEVEAVAVVR